MKRGAWLVLVLIFVAIGHSFIYQYHGYLRSLYDNNWSYSTDLDKDKSSLTALEDFWQNSREMSETVLRVYSDKPPVHLKVCDYNKYTNKLWHSSFSREALENFTIKRSGLFLSKTKNSYAPENYDKPDYKVYLTTNTDHFIPYTNNTTWVGTKLPIKKMYKNGYIRSTNGRIGYNLYETQEFEQEEDSIDPKDYSMNTISLKTESAFDFPKLRLKKLALEIADNATNTKEKVQLIHKYLIENHKYDLFAKFPDDSKDPVMDFIENKKDAHCQLFAAAAVLLLRSIDVPSRYTVGYLCNQYNEFGGYYVSRKFDAHAWVEYYDNGWQTFDPTLNARITPETMKVLNGLNGFTDYINMQKEFFISFLASGMFRYYLNSLWDFFVDLILDGETFIYISILVSIIVIAFYFFYKKKQSYTGLSISYLKHKDREIKKLAKIVMKNDYALRNTSLGRRKHITLMEWKNIIFESKMNEKKKNYLMKTLDEYQEKIYNQN